MAHIGFRSGRTNIVTLGYFYNDKWYSDISHTAEIPGNSGDLYFDLADSYLYVFTTEFVPVKGHVDSGE